MLGLAVVFEFPALARQIRISVSDCVLTETYSPVAIDIAPATRPASPAVITAPWLGAGRGDADHQARSGDDTVVRAENRGPQPADPARTMTFAVPQGRLGLISG